MDSTVLMVIACFIIFVTRWFVQQKLDRTPPGPLGLPLVGYLPFMTRKPHLKIMELGKMYGPVLSLRLGSQYVVVVNDFASMRKVLTSDKFVMERMKSTLLSETVSTDAHRHTSMRLLREAGFGKSRMEEHIQEELKDVLIRFEDTKGKPVNSTPFLKPSMSNIIEYLLFGRRMAHGDPKRIETDRMISELLEVTSASHWQTLFPWIRKMLKALKIGNQRKLAEIFRKLKDLIRNEVMEHEKTLDINNVRDFTDGGLLQMQGKSAVSSFTKIILERMILNFMIGGSHTTRMTVDRLLFVVAAYPDVQRKIQSEIDSVIGEENLPTWSDHLKMPYTEAAILEMSRWKTIASLFLNRYSLKGAELNGYCIPENTRVMANLWACHRDQDLWGKDADVYRPERFLNEEGSAVKKPEFFIPFSIGSRACPGENFARMEIFLFLTAMLQRFDVSLPEGQLPDLEEFGLSTETEVPQVCFTRRKICK